MEDKKCWEITSINECSPSILALNNGLLKYLEDPVNPGGEAISALKYIRENLGVLIMPPCSEETISEISKLINSLSLIIIVDHDTARLRVWEQNVTIKGNVPVSKILLTGKLAADTQNLVKEMDKSSIQFYLRMFNFYFPNVSAVLSRTSQAI